MSFILKTDKIETQVSMKEFTGPSRVTISKSMQVTDRMRFQTPLV